MSEINVIFDGWIPVELLWPLQVEPRDAVSPLLGSIEVELLHSQFCGSKELATMEVTNFDDLDLSFAADQHELDCCLPSLVMEDSFASDDSHREVCSSEADMDMEDDSFVQQWQSTISEMKSDEILLSPMQDIQWTPPLAKKQDRHLQRAAQMQSLQFLSCNSEIFSQMLEDDDNNASPKEIHWTPNSTTSSPKFCDTSSFVSARSTESLSLQAEYELSRQKLVVSMMRSQETRRYVQKLKSQSKMFQSSTAKEDFRDGMMLGVPCDSNVTEV